MHPKMKRRTALITGSSAGIGAETARRLAGKGFDVFVTGRDEGRLKQIAGEIGARGSLVGDLREEGFYKILFDAALGRLTSVDILINNAGAYEWSPVEKTDEKKVTELIELNLAVPFQLCRLAVPGMKNNRWGRIINIGSISGSVGETNASLYSASKAGLIGLTRSLALELAEFGITVNLINPGWVKTAMVEPFFQKGILNEAEELSTVPQKRWIEPSEISALVEYLVSEEAAGMTGQSLNLCAGLSLGL